jgi:hypothetical protein
LLQKYYDGFSTPEEESELADYFLQEDTDPEFTADRLHFIALSSIRDEDIPVPVDLELSVLQSLERVRKAEANAKKRILYTVMSIAAGVMLMISSVMFITRHGGPDPVTDPQVAYAESREALELVSKYFNRGTDKLSGLGILNEAVEPLEKLNSLDRVARNLSELGKSINEK